MIGLGSDDRIIIHNLQAAPPHQKKDRVAIALFAHDKMIGGIRGVTSRARDSSTKIWSSQRDKNS